MADLYPERMGLAKRMIPEMWRGSEREIQEAHTMSRRSPTVGRKVPRSAYVQDRRAILKLVPKLRKIKPIKRG
jgi:hypothetical protein